MRTKLVFISTVCILLVGQNTSAFGSDISSLISELGDWNKDKAKNASEELAKDANAVPSKVFGVPLNARIQEVVDALEKSGIKVSGLITKARFDKTLRSNITNQYNEMGISGSKKEQALKLLDENKIKPFYVKYEGKQQVVYPESLIHLLRYYYPVLERYYELYNSQFRLESSKLVDLPGYMTSQGIRRMVIYFATIDQSEPKSFWISLWLRRSEQDRLRRAEELEQGWVYDRNYYVTSQAGLLISKYGEPKLYYPESVVESERKSFLPGSPGEPGYVERELGPLLYHLVEAFPNHEVVPVGDMLYAKYAKVDHVICATIDFLNPYKVGEYLPAIEPVWVHGYKGPSITHGSFTFEWDWGNVKILFANQYNVVGTVEPLSVNYIYWPTIEVLDSMYEKLSSASEEAEAKMLERGKKGF